ncbi:MAG: cation-transporting P-type ATPase [Chloroflexota bacterium]
MGWTSPRGSPPPRSPTPMKKYGPNALPAEQAPPLWKRFLGEYRTYLRIVLATSRASCRSSSASGARGCCCSCSRSSTRSWACARWVRPRAP